MPKGQDDSGICGCLIAWYLKRSSRMSWSGIGKAFEIHIRKEANFLLVNIFLTRVEICFSVCQGRTRIQI